MKKTLLFFPLVLFIITPASFAQEKVGIFDEPHELNTEYWLSRFPHSFAPIKLDYTPTGMVNFDNYNISNDPEPQNEP